MLQPHPCCTHFEVLPEVHFIHTICCFKSWEARSPELQTVLNLELKRRSYSRLKTSAHTMNGNVAAAPLLDTFWSTSWSSNYAYYISFQSSGSQESNALNGLQIRAEMKKLWPFEDNYVNLKGHFETISNSTCEFEIQLMNLKSNSK